MCDLAGKALTRGKSSIQVATSERFLGPSIGTLTGRSQAGWPAFDAEILFLLRFQRSQQTKAFSAVVLRMGGRFPSEGEPTRAGPSKHYESHFLSIAICHLGPLPHARTSDSDSKVKPSGIHVDFDRRVKTRRLPTLECSDLT